MGQPRPVAHGDSELRGFPVLPVGTSSSETRVPVCGRPGLRSALGARAVTSDWPLCSLSSSLKLDTSGSQATGPAALQPRTDVLAQGEERVVQPTFRGITVLSPPGTMDASGCWHFQGDLGRKPLTFVPGTGASAVPTPSSVSLTGIQSSCINRSGLSLRVRTHRHTGMKILVGSVGREGSQSIPSIVLMHLHFSLT